MSVQVRRRREAASFLQTYVGAQGELLVDTTSNRVQVHDGVTPGGWPAAGIGDMMGRNTLINGNFAINQRAYASGTALAAGVYAHDRWKAGSGGCTYTFAQAVPDTTITIGSGTLVQAVEPASIYATSYWLSWTGAAQARVWQGSASGAYSAGATRTINGVTVNALLIGGLSIGTITNVEFSTGALGLVQFEAALANAGPTLFQRRPLGQEIVFCQRFFQVLGGNNITEVLGSGVCFSSTMILVDIPLLLEPMRTAPTVAFSAASTFQIISGSALVASAIAVSAATANSLALTVTPASAATAGFGAILRANGTTSTQINITAEL